MTTIKVNDITNIAGTGAPNFSDGIKYNGSALSALNTYEYTSSATEPSNPNNGALWWDSANSKAKIYVNNSWKTVTLSSADLTPVLGNGDRGMSLAGYTNVAPDYATDNMDYFSIPTPSNASSFGDLLTTSRMYAVGCSSGTRGVAMGGPGPAATDGDHMQYWTFATTGNAQDFGDLLVPNQRAAGAGNNIRGLYAGGRDYGDGSAVNTIQYITIDTTGNATDFGDLLNVTQNLAGSADATRSLFAGGNTGSTTDTIQYVTTDTTGNATDFGDLLSVLKDTSVGVTSNNTKGFFTAGYNTAAINVIQSVTIQTTGNATDHGDLTSIKAFPGQTSNTTHGIHMGGISNLSGSDGVNSIDRFTMDTTGNASDFGDLTTAVSRNGGVSGNPS